MNLIHARGSDYVIRVKENQGTLYRYIVQQAHTALPCTQSRQSETGHGRTIQRTVSTFDLADSFQLKWAGNFAELGGELISRSWLSLHCQSD